MIYHYDIIIPHVNKQPLSIYSNNLAQPHTRKNPQHILSKPTKRNNSPNMRGTREAFTRPQLPLRNQHPSIKPHHPSPPGHPMPSPLPQTLPRSTMLFRGTCRRVNAAKASGQGRGIFHGRQAPPRFALAPGQPLVFCRSLAAAAVLGTPQRSQCAVKLLLEDERLKHPSSHSYCAEWPAICLTVT